MEGPAPKAWPDGAERPPLSQQVYLTLREKLMVGGFSPGESVSLRTLAAQLGTSPMPVREAVGRLIVENALQMANSRQIIVPLMSRKRYEEIWRVRQMLEGMATRLACAQMNDDALQQLRELNDAAIAALEDNDAERILASNKNFHFFLYSVSRSMVLPPMIEGLWMQVGPFMRVSLATRIHWDGVQHTQLLTALRDRDAEAAEAAIALDISNTAQSVMEMNIFSPDESG